MCPSCDAANPSARGLLAYFASNDSVQPQDVSQVSELLGHWLSSLTPQSAPRPAPRSSLASDAEAWWARRQKADTAL